MTTQLKPSRIVVGIDGSEESKRALRWAAKLAADLDAGVDAIAAWRYPVAYGWAAPRWTACPSKKMRRSPSPLTRDACRLSALMERDTRLSEAPVHPGRRHRCNTTLCPVHGWWVHPS
jgi:hypothetical protein